MTPCCGEPGRQYGAAGRAAPLGGGTPHTRQPLHRPACGRGGSLKRLTQQRGNGGVELAACRCAGVCLQVSLGEEAHKLSQNGKPGGTSWRDPAHGEPHCSKHEGESPDLPCPHASFSFLLSCRALLAAPPHDGWRLAGSSDRSRQSVDGCLSRCSDCLGTPDYPRLVALPLHYPWQSKRGTGTESFWTLSASKASQGD